MDLHFICDRGLIDTKLKSLTKTGTTDGGWTIQYIDNVSGEQWLHTQYHSEAHGGGIPVLKKAAEINTEELIDMALLATDINNIVGASNELYQKEKNNNEEFRNRLLEKLLLIDITALTQFNKERLKIIITESRLSDPINRREVLSKHPIEIQIDADYYQSMANKAKKILSEIESS